eukprot:1808596-Amphidinium_carterae.1
MSFRLAAGALLVVTHAWIWNEPISGTQWTKELDPVEQELYLRSKANDSWFSWWHESETSDVPPQPKTTSWREVLRDSIPKNIMGFYDQPWWHTVWTATDLLVVGLLNVTGSLLFGQYWPAVRVGLRVLLGLSMVFAASLAMGFAWQAVSPVFNLLTVMLQVTMAGLMGVQSLFRPQACHPLHTKALQRGIRLWGPQTKQPGDTETFRTFKRVGAHVYGLDEGHAVLFHVEGRIGAINRHGLVLPGMLREGLGPHKGTRAQRLHLCRQQPCQSAEVGCIHVQAYGILRPEDEQDLAGCWKALTEVDVSTSAWALVLNWWLNVFRGLFSVLTLGLCRRRALPMPEPHPVSESENEEDHRGCEAGLVKWCDARGARVGLSMRGPCEEPRSEAPTTLLMEDIIGGSGGRTVAHLCWRHAAQYERERSRCRCPMTGCQRVGKHLIRGVSYCQAHAEELDAEGRSRTSMHPLLPSTTMGNFRVPVAGGAASDDIQPATPPHLLRVEQAAIERDYRSEEPEDYPQSAPTTARSITSPTHTPRPSVSELIQALPAEVTEHTRLTDYEVLHRYLEKRASGSVKGGRLSDEEARRMLQHDPAVERGDRASLLRSLIGGFQEL